MIPASEPRVIADGVWKKFRGGERQDSLRDLIPALTARMVRGAGNGNELGERDFWALQDVSFEVRAGEALGVIGPNGAGKSTLLKLLNRILRPTRGNIALRGRVAALIEVAAGFHPDLTGRENVFLQGAIMGMRRREMQRKLDSIVDFAGIAQFIDTPVKRYSNGMNARLGFAIAAHLEPDILLIDEVLSVGDMAFQEKCVVRMKEFKRNGAAVVFISHNMQAISDLCDGAIFLKSMVRARGPVEEVVGQYISSATEAELDTHGEVTIVSTRLVDDSGADVVGVRPGTPLRMSVDYQVAREIEDVHFAIQVRRSTDGLMVYNAHFDGEELSRARLGAGERFRIVFDIAAHLTRGQYHVDTHVYHNPTWRFVAQRSPAAHFRVDETRTYGGVADLAARAVVVET